MSLTAHSSANDRVSAAATAKRQRLGSAIRRVLAVVALARAAQFIETVLFPLVAYRHGAGTAGAALVLLAMSVGSTAGSLLGGGAVDRLGTRYVATAGLALAAGATGALAVLDITSLLALAALIYGAATATWRLALEAGTAHGLASDGVSGGDDQALRERAFGAFVWLVNAGALLSAGGLAAGLDLRVAVLVQAVTTAAAALASALLLSQSPRPSKWSTVPSPGFLGVPTNVWLLALAFAPFTIVMFQAFSGLARILDEDAYRLMILVNAATLVTFPPLLWRFVERLDGAKALAVAGAVQGAGIAATALLGDPLLATIVWSAGEAMLIAVMPAVVTGIAPHRAAGGYRAAFAAVQGAAAAVATFCGPMVAAASVAAFAVACVAVTVAGVAALLMSRSSVRSGLHQPVRCPCGALLCTCDASHISCAVPSPVVVHQVGQSR